MTLKLSHQAEEYIEAIYKIQKRSGAAKTKELAKELKVVPGSITNTVAHLERHGLVEHTPYRGVRLTVKGEKVALNIIRRHRLAERLLTDLLDADWSDVHETACKLEHALTEDVLFLLEKRLGYPKFCPHGNPIPTEDGEVKEVECCPLTMAAANQVCVVARIVDERRETLQSLADKGIKPNVIIHIARVEKDSLVLWVAGKKQTVSRKEAENVWVQIAEVGETDV